MGRWGRFALSLVTAALVCGFAASLPAQKTSKAEPDDWRARWKKQWDAKQARLAREKRQKALSLDVPPPVEDTVSSFSPAFSTETRTETGREETPSLVPPDLTAGITVPLSSDTGGKQKDPEAIAPEPIDAEAVIGSALPAGEKVARTPSPAASAKESDVLLSQTRPDIVPAPNLGETANRTQDNPFAAVGDSWRMIAYLLPLLVVLIGGMNLLRRFHERKGRLPAPLQALAKNANGYGALPSRPRRGWFQGLLGGLHLHNARETGGSNIRAVESIPLGGVNIHLIEVRGKLLLLGATGANVNLLAEWEEKPGLGGDEFRTLLQAAASDMDGLNLDGSDWPARAIVGTLEEEMRDTGSALTRRARRLRTVLEAEAESQQEAEYAG